MNDGSSAPPADPPLGNDHSTRAVLLVLPGLLVVLFVLAGVVWRATRQDGDVRHFVMAPASLRSSGNSFIDDAWNETSVTVDDTEVTGTGVKLYDGASTGSVTLEFRAAYGDGQARGEWRISGSVVLASGRAGTIFGGGPIVLDGLDAGPAHLGGTATISWSVGPSNTYDLSSYPVRLARLDPAAE